MLLLAKGPVASSNSYARAGRRRGRGRRRTTIPALHAADTLRAGRGLCRAERRPGADRARRRRGSPTSSSSASSSTTASAARAATRAAASSTRAAPRPGKAIAEVLAARVARASADRRRRGRARARALGRRRPLRRASSPTGGTVAARATLLATGGYAALWERTTNPPGALGEGLVLAYRAGRRARRPRVRAVPSDRARSTTASCSPRRCAARARCSLDDDGDRFTDELAPRDVVARAIAERGGARLDLRGDRARALPGPDGDARARRLRPGARADPGLAGRALHGRRHRHRPRRRARRCPASTRRASARAPACTARTGSRRTRCSSASSSAAAPRSPRCDEPEPRLRRAAAVPDARAAGDAGAAPRALARTPGVIRSADGLERLRDAPALLPRLVAESALARAREPRRPLPRRLPDRGRRVRRPRRPPAGREPVLERWS